MLLNTLYGIVVRLIGLKLEASFVKVCYYDPGRTEPAFNDFPDHQHKQQPLQLGDVNYIAKAYK